MTTLALQGALLASGSNDHSVRLHYLPNEAVATNEGELGPRHNQGAATGAAQDAVAAAVPLQNGAPSRCFRWVP